MVIIGLGITTFGIYFAYYMQRQSRVINKNIEESDEISPELTTILIIMSYVSLAMSIALIFLDQSSEYRNLFGSISNFAESALYIIYSLGFQSTQQVE